MLVEDSIGFGGRVSLLKLQMDENVCFCSPVEPILGLLTDACERVKCRHISHTISARDELFNPIDLNILIELCQSW